ncbi:GcvT family protein [Paraburkholderia kirstenboschensis]|uniref:FAD-dependent oxidoreductase n=1 Tax=Paraburkholderia kirstenboschensis TaxID=1245436 RepID=A0ABZ0EKX0_9BURK|nr:FAD-dependent oxidoreductase [Paraburkholderia kirstenboschensis]WOD16967.1 FAD-dependent oxidoreductase [Paraburkholderia kirstenboschensis]
MSDLPKNARVVVIGGGAVGASVLYHLTLRGWKDVVLLEANELTAGSTWHAAGNVPTFSGNGEIMRLQAYSADLYTRLGELAEYPINYHVTGSVRLAHEGERMEEYRQVMARGAYIGVPFEMLTPAQLKEIYPFIELDGLVGALWDPRDGDIDPAQLTQALARAARNGGARVFRHCPVTGLRQRDTAGWTVECKLGIIDADIIVNAAGYYAPKIGDMMGRSIPSVVLEHQYLITAEIDELKARGKPLPLLRDPEESYYLRQERNALLLGPYERERAKAQWIDGLPEDFSFQLFGDDLDRIENYIADACARIPMLADAGIQKVINGPVPYTPDGNPLIGPVPNVENAFEACAFSFGITQAGGAGKLLADMIVDGQPEWELWSCDPRRFTAHADAEYTRAKAIEVYENEYAIGFPQEERPAGRPAKTSPTNGRLQAKGALFGARNGWERPTWYVREQDDAAAKPTFSRPGWFDAVAEECDAVMNHVALIDLTGFSRFEISGPGAAAWLDTMITGRVPAVGRVGLSYMCNAVGGVLIEVTIAHLAENQLWVISASTGEWHDRDWLNRHLPKDGSVKMTEQTNAYGTLSLVGPKSRDVLAKVIDISLNNSDFPWMQAKPAAVNGNGLWAFRVNYTGELGYELHVPMDSMLGVYDAIHAAEPTLRDFGIYALDSLRLEKCYRSWKQDISIETTPLEASLDRFVSFKKDTQFIGRSKLEQQKASGVTKKIVPMLVDETDADACFGAAVRDKTGKVVGYVSSGGFGHRIKQSIALGFVSTENAVPGTELEIEILGKFTRAVVASEPLYDPDNSKLKA